MTSSRKAQSPSSAVVARKAPASAEILWFAVDRARRRQGHGTRLFAQVIGLLANDGVQLIEVKTLDRTANNLPYEGTRAFLGAQRVRAHRQLMKISRPSFLPRSARVRR
jgi:ribosomal protein S18 acetylase RimI-like enzyme